MSRFSESSSRWQRFVARNEGHFWRGLYRESLGKVYRRPALRRFIRPFIPLRQPDKWLFLVGCFNSGTTILRRLLESHPEISSFSREGAKLTDAFPDLEEGGWPRMMYVNRHLWALPEEGAPQRVREAQKDWSIWFDPQASVFLEKSIDHATRMDWLDRHFDNCYFLAITRNGYCVNEGIMRRARPWGPAQEEVGERYPPELCAEQWVHFDRTIAESLTRVARGHSLRYEDLMSDPLGELASIFAFLGLEQPSMTWNAPVLTIAEDRHELLDQNSASLARLEAKDREAMRPIMAETLARHGYPEA